MNNEEELQKLEKEYETLYREFSRKETLLYIKILKLRKILANQNEYDRKNTENNIDSNISN